MVTRTLLTVAATVGLSVGLLASQAAGAEGLVAHKAPAIAEPVVDAALFRREIEGFIRAQNELQRQSLADELRRKLTPKIVLAADELRARG